MSFYTRQEQDDILASQITNPNRVGSGFINLGPQQRFAQGPAANWQTSSLVGGPQQEDGARGMMPPQPAAAPIFAQQQAMKTPVAPFAAPGTGLPVAPDPHVGSLFNAFSMGAAGNSHVPPAPVQHSLQPPVATPSFSSTPAVPGGMRTMPPAMQQHPTHASAPFQSGLGNGSVPRMMPASFSPLDQPPQMLHAQVNVPPNALGAPPSARMAAPAAPAPVPKKLQSAADYAAAAQQYKPPSSTNTSASAASITRKAESMSLGSSRGGASEPASAGGGRGANAAAGARAADWACSRCTFLNNASLRECDMCGFQRPDRPDDAQPTPQPAAHGQGAAAHDAGWQTASQQRRPAQAQQGAQGKSKAQAKNEKRRAKKRDGSD